MASGPGWSVPSSSPTEAALLGIQSAPGARCPTPDDIWLVIRLGRARFDSVGAVDAVCLGLRQDQDGRDDEHQDGQDHHIPQPGTTGRVVEVGESAAGRDGVTQVAALDAAQP